MGAGPAGLQAAIAAARNGHRVTVHEASSAAGGQVRLAASVPNRAELGDLVPDVAMKAQSRMPGAEHGRRQAEDIGGLIARRVFECRIDRKYPLRAIGQDHGFGSMVDDLPLQGKLTGSLFTNPDDQSEALDEQDGHGKTDRQQHPAP